MSHDHRIHIFGASGSGTTTLGSALSKRLNTLHLDTDDYYWKETEIPYTEKYSPAERIHNIKNRISAHQSWVLSGSLCSWGGPLTEFFSHAIFVYLNPEVRLRRLRQRERLRYGGRIDRSGDMHEKHNRFLEWAAAYDTAVPPTRSLQMHRAWVAELKCPVIELNSNVPVDVLVHDAIESL